MYLLLISWRFWCRIWKKYLENGIRIAFLSHTGVRKLSDVMKSVMDIMKSRMCKLNGLVTVVRRNEA